MSRDRASPQASLSSAGLQQSPYAAHHAGTRTKAEAADQVATRTHRRNSMQSQQELLQQMVDRLIKRVGPDSRLVQELQRQIVSEQPRPQSPNPIGEDKR